MRLVMLGTGPFAVPTLRQLVASSHEVLRVVTRPPRSRRAEAPPMQVAAEELGLPLWQPDTVNSEESRSRLSADAPDLLVVCDYGEILKPETLAITPHGGINLHGSLLPKYRGAAPVQWAVLNGDAETGNTVIQMTAGLDAGPCLGVDVVPIDPDETAGELEARLAARGGALVLSIVDALAAGTTVGVKQDRQQASKAPRLEKEHGAINWSRSAQEIKNQVRALDPWPRAYTSWQRTSDQQKSEPGEPFPRPSSPPDPIRLILHRTQVVDPSPTPEATPGTVLDAGHGRLLIATGASALEILALQPAGKRVMPAAEFLRGYRLTPGQRLE